MISVIVPVYNAQDWLPRCLDSIVDQTVFEQLEVICIDDGSVDQSGAILDDYAAKYSNFVIKHIKNGGVSNARNLGIDLAQGEFVTFADADDYLEPVFMEAMLKAVDEECDLVCSGFLAEYSNHQVNRCPAEEVSFSNGEAMKEFLLGGRLEPNVWDKLFRRSLIGDKRFDKRIAIAEDKFFLFHCLKDARQVRLIPQANYHYVMNDDGACRKDFNKKRFHSTYVADRIAREIREDYPVLTGLAESMAMDVKCRVYGDMHRNKAYRSFPKEYRRFRREIRRYPLWKKMKNSNKKHTAAFLAAKISPALYNFLKHDMKLQYE